MMLHHSLYASVTAIDTCLIVQYPNVVAQWLYTISNLTLIDQNILGEVVWSFLLYQDSEKEMELNMFPFPERG